MYPIKRGPTVKFFVCKEKPSPFTYGSWLCKQNLPDFQYIETLLLKVKEIVFRKGSLLTAA